MSGKVVTNGRVIDGGSYLEDFFINSQIWWCLTIHVFYTQAGILSQEHLKTCSMTKLGAKMTWCIAVVVLCIVVHAILQQGVHHFNITPHAGNVEWRP